MARHALERRARALLHRRCACAREVPALGRDRAALPAQPALPLDPPRAQAPLRHQRPPARARHRRWHLARWQRAPEGARFQRARHHAPDARARGLHHRRSLRQPGAPSPRPRRRLRDPGAAHLAARQGRRHRRPRGLQCLDRTPRGRQRPRDRELAGLPGRPGRAPSGLPPGGLPLERPWAGHHPRRTVHRSSAQGGLRARARRRLAHGGGGGAASLRHAPPGRGDGSRGGLGAAVPHRSAAQQQHPRAPRPRPRQGLRLDRRPELRAGRWRASSTASTRTTGSRAPSCTTSIRATTR